MSAATVMRPTRGRGRGPRGPVGRGRPRPGPMARRPPKKPGHLPFWKRRVKEQELVALCQHLSALSGSGVSLANCIETFAAEAPNGVLQRVLAEILGDLEAGRKFSTALDRHQEHFSAYFRASVWAGEAGGNMTETFDRLSAYLTNRQETRQRIRNAFAYPVVLSCVIVGVVTFLMLYVVPVFAQVYARMNVDLPVATQLLLSFSDTLVNRPWVPVLPAIVVLGLAVWVKRSKTGRMQMDRWKMRLPILGTLFRQLTLYRFTRAFGEMMGSGVPVLEALDLAGRVTGNLAFDHDLEGVRSDVQRGLGLTEPLRRTGWFSPSLLQVISSGEQSGRIPALLGRAADILQRDIDLTVKRIVGRVEPLLTVGMAVIVGVVLLAVYLPMFDVMQHVGK